MSNFYRCHILHYFHFGHRTWKCLAKATNPQCHHKQMSWQRTLWQHFLGSACNHMILCMACIDSKVYWNIQRTFAEVDCNSSGIFKENVNYVRKWIESRVKIRIQSIFLNSIFFSKETDLIFGIFSKNSKLNSDYLYTPKFRTKSLKLKKKFDFT